MLFTCVSLVLHPYGLSNVIGVIILEGLVCNCGSACYPFDMKSDCRQRLPSDQKQLKEINHFIYFQNFLKTPSED